MRRYFAVTVLVLALTGGGPAGADGLPEPAPRYDGWARAAPIIVQSSDALSPSFDTAAGRFSASSGDVDPGGVTSFSNTFWLPDIGVEVDARFDRRRGGPRARRLTSHGQTP